MEKFAIIDCRMRKIEKEKIKSLGYTLIEIQKLENVYPEISSHVDIFCSKINDEIIVEKSKYKEIKQQLNSEKIICGNEKVYEKYPEDVKYNVCQISNYVIHNFKYTDSKILEKIEKSNLKKINISQGYANCSIANITDDSVITTDLKISKILKNENIDVLYLKNNLDIKLLNFENKYSKMQGFIGGAIGQISNKIIVFGDLNKIDKNNQIRNFITQKKLEIIEFEGLDVIDYGGIVTLEK